MPYPGSHDLLPMPYWDGELNKNYNRPITFLKIKLRNKKKYIHKGFACEYRDNQKTAF